MATATATASTTYRRIWAAVSRIPRGRVATYGQVAAVAGLPRQARLVGYALAVLGNQTWGPSKGPQAPPRWTPPGKARLRPRVGSHVPWHRVVNAKGQISIRSNGLGHDELQAQLLRREGVRFVAGAIPLERYRWRPRATAR